MNYLKIGISILFFAVIVLFFLLAPRLLIINNISCSNQYGSCSEILQQDLGAIKGKSLRKIKGLVVEMMKQNLFVKEYTLRYIIPDKIVVYVIVKKPKFTLKSNKNNALALIDQDGVVLGYSENTTLPVVVFSQGLIAVGESVSTKELFALKLVSSMDYYYQVKEGTLIEDRLEVFLGDGVKVILPLEGDREVLLGSLKVVLSRLNENAKDAKIERVSEIDLRFKNPVLR